MGKVEFTPVAAEVVKDLPASIKKVLKDFFDHDFADWRVEHEPTELPGVDGRFWLVKPIADAPILAITEREEDGAFVVVAALEDDDRSLSVDPGLLKVWSQGSAGVWDRATKLGAAALQRVETVY